MLDPVRLFKLSDTINNFSRCRFDFLDSDVVELLRLLVFELELALLPLLLVGHVLFPVLHSLLEPLLHEAGVPLELVDLGSSHFLLLGLVQVFLVVVVGLSFVGLARCFVVELLQVVLHVHRLLGLVQRLKTGLEEAALHLVVRVLAWTDLQSRLVVAHLSCLTKNSDVGRRVDLLQNHLDLVKQSESVASLLLHDLVDESGVELDVEVP